MYDLCAGDPRAVRSYSPTAADTATDVGASMEVEGGFTFKTPMENLVIKTFQFPVRWVYPPMPVCC